MTLGGSRASQTTLRISGSPQTISPRRQVRADLASPIVSPGNGPVDYSKDFGVTQFFAAAEPVRLLNDFETEEHLKQEAQQAVSGDPKAEFNIGDAVEVREDDHCKEWKSACVTSVDPLLVKVDGWSWSTSWEFVRKAAKVQIEKNSQQDEAGVQQDKPGIEQVDCGTPKALRSMLQDDQIAKTFPEHVPTDEEVASARELLHAPENADVLVGIDSIQIASALDATLYRFCWLARSDGCKDEEVAPGAISRLRSCLERRAALGMDTILDKGPFTESFLELHQKALPFSFHGTDRQGHPIVIYRYGSLDLSCLKSLWTSGKEITEENDLPVNAVALFHLRAMEYLTKHVMAKESQRQGRIVDRALFIVDMQGVGPQHFNTTFKELLQTVARENSTVFPEIMHSTVLANMNWLLAKGADVFARGLLHPVTKSKFVFATVADTQETLAELVEPKDLPPYLGGTNDCEEYTMRAWDVSCGLLNEDPTSLLSP